MPLPTQDIVEQSTNRRLIWVVSACTIAIPLFWALLLPWTASNTTIFAATPLINVSGNDEVSYWHQVAAFARAGFDSGQYGYEEDVAALSFFRFGAHGPAYPVMMGMVAKLVGWNYATPMIVHVSILALAIAFFVSYVRGTMTQRLWVAGILIVFWPAWVFMITVLQEPLHIAFAIVLAAFLIRFAQDGDGFVGAIVMTLIASLFRPTWSLMLFPIVLWKLRDATLAHKTLGFAACCAGVVCTFGLLYLWGAPYPYGANSELFNADGWRDSLAVLMGNVQRNFGVLSSSGEAGRARYVMRLLTVVLAAVVLVLSMKHAHRSRVQPESVFWSIGVWAVAGVVALSFVMNTTEDPAFRTWMPHVLVLVLVGVVIARTTAARIVLIAVAIVAALSLPSFVADYADKSAVRYQAAPKSVARLGRDLAPMKYVASGDRWCNTVLWRPYPMVNPDSIIAIPVGMGYVVDLERTLNSGIQSRWVIAERSWLRNSQPNGEWEFVTMTEFGALFRNTQRRCGS